MHSASVLIWIVRVLLFGYVLLRIGKAGWLGLLNVARFGVLALRSGDAAVRGPFAASWVLEADTDCDQLPLNAPRFPLSRKGWWPEGGMAMLSFDYNAVGCSWMLVLALGITMCCLAVSDSSF
ncbi:hypothetical protein Nepgr_033630 [Nepenthes gracilis]|uniref:Uncharacterized protein n=1 Tax=Nepenthes gracilis TaxID=150966 RepID=A0AAD3Y928_NEPGR|nr:hypothetical protein Nepgr_033630 [Nepenthes gracilis]